MTLSKDDIKQIRDRLGFTQVQFGSLLGVHPLTVSKWERGALQPTPHQQALITSFRTASTKQENVGKTVGELLITAGVIVALLALLNAAVGDNQ